MDGRLVIISAPSGAGKTTIVKFLLNKSLNLEFSVSATTREPRGNEKNGHDYYFISADDFRKKIENGQFAEWEEVYEDQYYGTLRSEIERIWKKGRNVLFDIDVKGGIHLKNIYGTKAIAIFIMPPSLKELEKRLISRATDGSSGIKARVSKACQEIRLADRFDSIVVNDNLDRAQEEVYSKVKSFLES